MSFEVGPASTPEALALGRPQLAQPFWRLSEGSLHLPALQQNLEVNGCPV